MKSFLKSKLFWTGVVLFIGAGLQAIKPLVTPEVANIIVAILGILVICFRAVTGETISFGSKVFGKKS